MLHLIQPILSLLIGLAMTLYGIVHAVTRFPGPDAFASLVANLPAVTSVLMFVLGLLAFVAGIVLLIVGIRNLRRRWHRFNLIARHVDSRPQYGDVGGDDGGDGGEGWEPAAYR